MSIADRNGIKNRMVKSRLHHPYSVLDKAHRSNILLVKRSELSRFFDYHSVSAEKLR